VVVDNALHASAEVVAASLRPGGFRRRRLAHGRASRSDRSSRGTEPDLVILDVDAARFDGP